MPTASSKPKTRKLKLLLCAIGILCGSAFSLDRNAFTFTEYELHIQLDPPQHAIGVQGTVTLRNDSSMPQKNPVLQISSSLEWQSVTLAHKKTLYVTHLYQSDVDHTGELNEAVVTLPQPVAPGQTVELEVAYAGTITQDATRLTRIGTPEEKALAADWDQIGADFTGVRGMGYVAWYPIAMEAASLDDAYSYSLLLNGWKKRHENSTLHAQFSGPTGLAVHAPGFSILAKDRKQAPDPDIPNNYFFEDLEILTPFFLAGNFQRLNAAAVDVYFLPGHDAVAKEYLAAGQSCLDFGTWAGHHVVLVYDLPFEAASPYEERNFIMLPLKQHNMKDLQVILSHARAQANLFYWKRAWMRDGLTGLAPALQREEQSGRQAALDLMQQQLSALSSEEKDIASSEAAHSVDTSLAAGTNEVLYRSKAMYVWWMLRDMLGDTVVTNALAKYKPEEDREPSHVQRLLEQEAKIAHVVPKMALEQFFDDWVYRDRGLPDFTIKSTYTRKLLGALNGNNFIVTVTVQNLGSAGAEVPVMVSTGGQERVTQRLAVPAHGEASVRIFTINQPEHVSVNDGSVPETDMSNNSSSITPPVD